MLCLCMPAYRIHPLRRQTPLPEPWFPAFSGDEEFDWVYPESIQTLSRCHWTPVEVARKAAQFLVTKSGTRVLDVGCGPGKFCAVGAATTEGFFTGVEQREHLVTVARRMLQSHGIPRVEFLHANVLDVEFAAFEAFYIFNPFQENMFPAECIDAEVRLDSMLYYTYSSYVRMQLSSARKGTRVATYWGNDDEIPPTYDCMESHFGGKLKFWVKKRQSQILAMGRKQNAVPVAGPSALMPGAVMRA